MKKSTKKWIVGSGVLAAGLAGVRAASHGISSYLVKIAMDREGPNHTKKRKEKVSGSKENTQLELAATGAKLALEEAPHQLIQIQAHDGIHLVGHWYPNEAPRRIIIAMHGWRSGWSRDFGMIAPFWRDNGCSVLYAEQRAQGQSGGDYMGFGLLERYDCKNWIRWVARQDPQLPIYLAGVSMGATTVLMTGGLDLPPQVHGIMADCGFTSAHEIWKHVAEKNLRLHYGLYGSAANDLCKKRIRIGAKDHAATDALRNCKTPVLFIHGTDDSFVPITMTYDNYKACTGEKRLFVVPGAEHALSYWTDRAGYEKTVLEFWDEWDHKQPPIPESVRETE